MRKTVSSVANAQGGVKPPAWRSAPAPGDAVLVVAVLLVAALLGAGGGDSPRPATVVVQSDSDARILPLDAAGRLEARGPLGISIVEVEAGRARVLASPCAQQICVRRGWLDGAGDIAACVPNRLVVRLEGPAGADFDGVSH